MINLKRYIYKCKNISVYLDEIQSIDFVSFSTFQLKLSFFIL